MGLLAKVWYAADVVVGSARGARCPSCAAGSNEVVARKVMGLASIRRCGCCGLLYRPVGLAGPKFAKFYYSYIYSGQGIATQPLEVPVEQALLSSSAAGKDRTELIGSILGAGVQPVGKKVAVLGASWGYEVLQLQRLGLAAIGIEASKPRREFGSRRYGLSMYPDATSAARDQGSDFDLVFSSHTLEHIHSLSDLLADVDHALRPRMHVHVTPKAEDSGRILRSHVGREHPIGVTSEWWSRRGAGVGWSCRMWEHRPRGEQHYCELVAVSVLTAHAAVLQHLEPPESRAL